MSRKLTSVYDASLKLRCFRPGCGHEFLVKPSALESNRRATCPKCLVARELSDEEIMHRRAENVSKFSAVFRAERGEGSDEPS